MITNVSKARWEVITTKLGGHNLEDLNMSHEVAHNTTIIERKSLLCRSFYLPPSCFGHSRPSSGRTYHHINENLRGCYILGIKFSNHVGTIMKQSFNILFDINGKNNSDIAGNVVSFINSLTIKTRSKHYSSSIIHATCMHVQQ